ncbi:MAG: Flp family type IVb pilin [Alphaproteobacteria bacterium]|nr:Flp family type IVb pilin [Alphaproteobacteria bacterium]
MWKDFIKKFLCSEFLRSDKGATAIEYGLITVGIASAIAAVTVTVGGDLATFFGSVPALFAG